MFSIFLVISKKHVQVGSVDIKIHIFLKKNLTFWQHWGGGRGQGGRNRRSSMCSLATCLHGQENPPGIWVSPLCFKWSRGSNHAEPLSGEPWLWFQQVVPEGSQSSVPLVGSQAEQGFLALTALQASTYFFTYLFLKMHFPPQDICRILSLPQKAILYFPGQHPTPLPFDCHQSDLPCFLATICISFPHGLRRDPCTLYKWELVLLP